MKLIKLWLRHVVGELFPSRLPPHANESPDRVAATRALYGLEHTPLGRTTEDHHGDEISGNMPPL